MQKNRGISQMGYKIIASDLDGTLFNNQGVISKQNYEAIEKLNNFNVHFVPASGRSFEEMPKELKNCPFIRYYIGSDGGTVYDKVANITHQLALPTELGHYVLDKLYQYPINMMLHADNNSYVDADMHTADDYHSYNYNDRWVEFVMSTNTPIKNFKTFAYEKQSIELFCVFFQNHDDLLECKEFFEKHPDLLVAQSDKYNLEIFWKNAGKGNALLLLAEILGVDAKDTIAVGDSTNDSTMVKAAGLGLAMDNAVSELKEIADAIICDNDNHSTNYILENYIKSNI